MDRPLLFLELTHYFSRKQDDSIVEALDWHYSSAGMRMKIPNENSDAVKRLFFLFFIYSRDLISFAKDLALLILKRGAFYSTSTREAVCKWIRTQNNESGQQRELARHYAPPRCPCNPLCRMILVALCSVTQFASRHAGGPLASHLIRCRCDETLKKRRASLPCLVRFPPEKKCQLPLWRRAIFYLLCAAGRELFFAVNVFISRFSWKSAASV